MSSPSYTWQKYETKTSKRKKPGAPSGKATGGSGALTSLPVNNMFEDAKDYLSTFKQEVDTSNVNGIGGSSLTNGGMGIGEFANENDLTKSPKKLKKPASGKDKKPPVKVEISYAINLHELSLDKISSEIRSLSTVDKDKRCLSLAVFLNLQKSHVEATEWETNSFSFQEPLKSIPKNIVAELSEFITELPVSCLATNFELCLAELLAKSHNNATVWGYKTMIQLLAKHHPEDTILKPHKNLSHLFANSVLSGGLSRAHAICWAYMQPLHWNPVVAMKIWCKILLPNISNKRLANCVASTLSQLMTCEDLINEKEGLNHPDYFHLLDYTFPKTGIKDIVDPKTHKVLVCYYPTIKAMAFTSGLPKNIPNFFTSFLSRFKTTQTEEMRLELSENLALCFKANSDVCYKLWEQMFDSYMEQTMCTVENILFFWDKIPDFPIKPLRAFLSRLENYITSPKNNQVTADEKAEQVQVVAKLRDRLTTQPKKQVSFHATAGQKKAPKTNKGSLLTSPFVMLLTLALIAMTVDLYVNPTQPYTKKIAGNIRVAGETARNWLWATYPEQMDLLVRMTSPYISVGKAYVLKVADWLRISVPNSLDYIYRDGPVELWHYFDKNYLPQLNKGYKLHVLPSLRFIGKHLDNAVDWVFGSLNFEFLRSYVK